MCVCVSVYLFLDSCELLDSDDESVCVCVCVYLFLDSCELLDSDDESGRLSSVLDGSQ